MRETLKPIQLTISVVRDPTTKAGLWCGSRGSMALIEIQSKNTKKDERSQKYIEQKIIL